MSAMKVLVELNMLNEQDSQAIDRSELRHFQEAQEQEVLLAAKRKRVNASPQPRVHPKKRWLTKVVEEPVIEEVPRLVSLVIPPSRPAPSAPGSAPSGSEHLSAALPLVSTHATGRLGSVQVEAPTCSLGPGSSSIKASREDPAVNKMSPIVHPPLVPRILSQHPYRENATLTSTLCDTSVSLEACQGELDQLQESVSSAAQQQELYDRLLDQVQTLERALHGPPNESLVDRFRGLEEDLRLACKSRAKYLSRFESSSRRNEELETSLRKKIKTLQEEVHCFRERALFAEKMIHEYPKEGSYSVSLPPLAEVQGELNETLASLCRVATFTHRLYRCDPASILHQHNQYVGVIIDAVISFLQPGLDTSDEDVLTRNFQLALHSIQWFFANAAEREEGIYRLVLAHSRFSDDAPFLNVVQHASFIAPFDDSLEPPLHCRMFALEMALPHHGAGVGSNDVELYLLCDTPLPQGDPQEEGSGHHEEGVGGGTAAVPLFLPDSLSPTPVASAASPPSLPPCFGSIVNLAIDMTVDEDNEDIYESPGSIERRNHLEGNPGEDDPMGDGPIVH
ncbi:hypothetical protein GG344DRAFT_83093 [Lentinula edodes]|nr:hypothetical protein GG344DRAFT_83093 [Lentinula edodes]